jgi:hydrogenase maturation factor
MDAFAAHCEQVEGCITCGDLGVPMRVVSADAATGLARCVTESGETSEVETALVGPVTGGDPLLVHAGTAIARLEEPATGRSPAG